MRPVIVTTGRHPFEVAIMCASLLVGVWLTCSDVRPKSVAASMPPLVQGLWEISLMAAGAIGLLGILWRGRLRTSLGVELAGVVILAAAATMYAIAIFAASGRAGFAAGTFLAGIAIASWARAVQIIRDLLRAARATRDGALAGVPILVERDRS